MISRNAYDPPLTDEEMAAIAQLAENPQSGAAEGLRPEVAALAQQVRQQSLSQIRATYALPDTWVPGTTDQLNWTPITVDGVVPNARGQAAGDDLLINTGQYLNENEEAMQNLQGSIPPNHPGQISIQDFMKAIAEAIQEFKKFLYEEQSRSDAKWVQGFTDERQKAIKQQGYEHEEIMELTKKGEKKQKIMSGLKIGMYVAAAVIALAGMISAVFTGGSGALLVAVAVTLISIAVSVADSQTGFMSKGITAAVDGLASAVVEMSGGAISEDDAKIISGVTLLIIAIAVTVALVAASGGGGSSGVQATSSIVKETVKATALNVSMALVVAAIGPLTMNVVEQIIKQADPNMSEETRKLIAMLTSLLVTLAAGAAMGATMSKGMKNIEGAKGSGGTAQATGTTTATANEGASMAKRMMEQAKQAWSNLPQDTKNSLSGAADKMTAGVNIGLPATQGAMSMAMGAMLLQQAQIEKEKGYAEADIHAIQALIKLLDKLLEHMQSTIGGEMKMIGSLDNVQKNMYRGASAELSKGWNAVQA